MSWECRAYVRLTQDCRTMISIQPCNHFKTTVRNIRFVRQSYERFLTIVRQSYEYRKIVRRNLAIFDQSRQGIYFSQVRMS